MTVIPIASLAEFLEIINGDQVAFVDFWATWCGPCGAIKPVYERLSDEHGAIAKFYSVDIDAHDDISQEVRVTGVPTIIAFKGGNPVGTVVGAQVEPLSAFVAKHASIS